jgi:protein involved in polysaccharide export with SLBB domain
MISIAPVRAIISRRFPVCSFAVRVAPRHVFEIACATHPRLFQRELVGLRAHDNWFSTRTRGWLRAPRGHAVLQIPDDVTRRLSSAARIYYLLAAYPSVSAAPGELALGNDGPQLGYVRVAPEWRARLAGRALASDDDFTDDSDDDTPASSAPAAAAVDAKLVSGMVVSIEIRDGTGAVLPLTHEYPVDADGNVRLPGVGKVEAGDLKTSELREAIGKAIAQTVSSAAVNVLPSDKTVGYSDPIQPGDRLYVRVLAADGRPDPATGSYTVDPDGMLHLPVAGDVDTGHTTLKDLEAGLEQAFTRTRVPKGVAHVTKVALT